MILILELLEVELMCNALGVLVIYLIVNPHTKPGIVDVHSPIWIAARRKEGHRVNFETTAYKDCEDTYQSLVRLW